MDEVIESMFNGQRKQALKQLDSKGLSIVDLFEFIENDEFLDTKEIITMTKIAISTGYISFNPANLRDIR